MPLINKADLTTAGEALFKAAGASEHEAGTVTRHLVGANLVGHESHGVIQIPTYVERMAKGHIVPRAPMKVIRESATTAVIDGHWGFGYTTSEYAMEKTIDKALGSGGVAACTVLRQGHVGRVADYPMMAAKAGCIGLMTADSGRSPKAVAPFGGRVPRLGTNPICIAVPSNLSGTFVLDMATSAAAAGKLKVARAKGEPVPSGWLVDENGAPSTDPSAVARGGALLPLGGAEGFKGYGLAAMVEILSGILPGLGFGVDPDGFHNDGVFMAAFAVEAFLPLEQFKQQVTQFAEYLTATPPAQGFERVYYPGELEYMREQQRTGEGIPLDDGTWKALGQLADELGVAEVWPGS
ncbi:MAG: Ldh family oxidoreductase [Gammaproteobacteria bacterium]|nr:Ldh family oxidoreductase [Gammaproteobacteria bacterium]